MSHFDKKMLSFFITTKCNMCCKYCYNAAERHRLKERTISLKIAKAAIDWYFNNTRYRHIRFYGPGEPTQEFTRLREITEYAKHHILSENRVTTEMQTNGVFSKHIREWCSENIDIMWVSFDGLPDIQNSNRPINPEYAYLYDEKKSSEVLEDNITWLINNSVNGSVIGARVTITDRNVNQQIEMIDYFDSLGLKYVWTDPLFHPVGTCPFTQSSQRNESDNIDLQLYVNKYYQAYKYAERKGLFWGSFLAVNFDGSCEYHCRACDPISAPHITPDGYISACDLVLLGTEAYHMAPFVVGKWDDDKNAFSIDAAAVDVLRKRNINNMPHCLNCEARLQCGGYCLGETLNEVGDLYGQDKNRCKAIVDLYHKMGTVERYPLFHP